MRRLGHSAHQRKNFRNKERVGDGKGKCCTNLGSPGGFRVAWHESAWCNAVNKPVLRQLSCTNTHGFSADGSGRINYHASCCHAPMPPGYLKDELRPRDAQDIQRSAARTRGRRFQKDSFPRRTIRRTRIKAKDSRS